MDYRYEVDKADINSFERIDSTGFFKDKNNVYYEGEKILCFYNFSVFEEIAYVSEVEDYVNVFTNEGMKARDLRIPSHDFLWLKTSF